jgi:dTDP-4-dehydrorhamnose 3,5-epimerase
MGSTFAARELGLQGVLEILPRVHSDARGDFVETWREASFRGLGIDAAFVQDNQSRSLRGVLRGLHFQRRRPQGKLIRAITGEIFDAVVDLRSSSPTFGRWIGLRLSGGLHNELYVPPGFAHGFLVLSAEAIVAYRCTEYYDPDDEGGIRWDDPRLGVDWPDCAVAPLVSARDLALPAFDPAGPWFDDEGKTR